MPSVRVQAHTGTWTVDWQKGERPQLRRSWGKVLGRAGSGGSMAGLQCNTFLKVRLQVAGRCHQPLGPEIVICAGNMVGPVEENPGSHLSLKGSLGRALLLMLAPKPGEEPQAGFVLWPSQVWPSAQTHCSQSYSCLMPNNVHCTIYTNKNGRGTALGDG